jgi:hypothetical protein
MNVSSAGTCWRRVVRRVLSPRVAGAATLLVCGFAVSNRAYADEPDVPSGATQAVEIARSHFLRGVQFFNAGDYKLSLEEFRRSYELSQNYRILYNIGQVHQQLNNYSKALVALERYLAEGGAEVPDERRSEVGGYVSELKRKVAHVVLVANVPEPEVLVDGFPAPEGNGASRLTVDPGDHRVELRKAGYQPASTVLTLAAGDTTELRLNLVRLPPPDLHATRSALPAPHERSVPWAGWITTGVLAAGAGITGALAASEASDLSTLRRTVSSESQRDTVSKRAHAYAIACDALAAGAVVSGGISLYLTLHSGRAKQRETAAKTELVLGPTRVVVAGSF